MADLSQWAFALDFLGFEAALLILGFDPKDRFKPPYGAITERMEGSYQNALNYFSKGCYAAEPAPGWLDQQFFDKPDMFVSVQMLKVIRTYQLDRDSDKCKSWLKHGFKPGFNDQRFSRQEITRWVAAIGQRSVYQFELQPAESGVSVDAPATRWPWGNYHTELLGHLEAAARRFWVNYDPADQSTAPTKSMVSEWLQNECKVSAVKAESVVNVLKADGLRPGPRK